jgi:hypothetical protein
MDELRKIGIPIPPLPRFNHRRFADQTKMLAARMEHKKKLGERRKEIRRLARQHGKVWCLYAMRHGIANRKLVQGHNHLTVAELLGHRVLPNTNAAAIAFPAKAVARWHAGLHPCVDQRLGNVQSLGYLGHRK